MNRRGFLFGIAASLVAPPLRLGHAAERATLSVDQLPSHRHDVGFVRMYERALHEAFRKNARKLSDFVRVPTRFGAVDGRDA